jgi:uncharacterized membrane protein YphA (DoxX/SURF4 family)
VAAAVCLLLAGTLAWAGAAKAADPAPFRLTLRALAAPRGTAVAVPALELSLAALLVAGVAPRATAAAVAALLAAFTVVLGRLGPASCHCFGADDGGAGRLRNVLLAAGALALVAWPAGPLWSASAGELAGAATVAAGAACAWRLAVALARLRPAWPAEGRRP